MPPSPVRVATRFIRASKLDELLQALFFGMGDPDDAETAADDLRFEISGLLDKAVEKVVDAALYNSEVTGFGGSDVDTNGYTTETSHRDTYLEYWYTFEYPVTATLRGTASFDLASMINPLQAAAREAWRNIPRTAVSDLFRNRAFVEALAGEFKDLANSIGVSLNRGQQQDVQNAFEEAGDLRSSTTLYSDKYPEGRPAVEGPGYYPRLHVDDRIDPTVEVKVQGTTLSLTLTAPLQVSYLGMEIGRNPGRF